jgi:hypothetical protein
MKWQQSWRRQRQLAYLRAVTYSFLAVLLRIRCPIYASPDRQIAVDLDALGHISPGSSGHLGSIASRLLQTKTLAQSRRPQL